MRQKAVTPESPSERIVNDIHPATPEALFGRALDHCWSRRFYFYVNEEWWVKRYAPLPLVYRFQGRFWHLADVQQAEILHKDILNSP